MKSVFVASSMMDHELAQSYMRALEARNIPITIDWVQHMLEVNCMVRGADADFRAVSDSDTLWCIVTQNPTRGMWVELGVGLYRMYHHGVVVVLSGDREYIDKCVYAHLKHPNLHIFDTHEEAQSFIISRHAS